MKNQEENKKQSEELTILSPIIGLARSIAGLLLGASLIGFSFARSIIGSAVNLSLAMVGSLATTTSFIVHLGNFSRVQAIKLFNKDTKAKTDSTKEIFNKAVKFTNKRLKAAFSTFHLVFSGQRDEEMKESIISLIKPKEIYAEPKDIRNEQQKIEQLIKDIPNTKESIIYAAQLILGMSKKERETANQRKNPKISRSKSKQIQT